MRSTFLPVALLLAPLPVAAQSAPATLAADAEEFAIYTQPMLEVMRIRDGFLRQNPANRFVHARTLADDKSRAVTAPNNDTIYSSAFIDLRGGPMTIAVPATGQRYFSLALMDAWTNNIAYFGTRATGGKAVTVTLVGPGGQAPASAGHVVRSPTAWVWAIGRTLVSGPADLPAGRAVQDGLVISGGVAGPTPPATPPRTAPAGDLHAAALRLLAENPPLPGDAAEIARFRKAGLDRPVEATGPRAEALTQGFAAALRPAGAAPIDGKVVNGWIYPKAGLGNFGTDYRYRAKVSVGGIGALERAEAMYLSAVGPNAGLFDGAKRYRIHFAKGSEPPVNSFWSLTLYERTEDGRFFLVPNPIGRYSFGDRTMGTTRNADGSFDIWIGHDDPGADKRANWLPAPAGPFTLTLRTYLPKPELTGERWRAPAVEEVAP